jgi:Holliday junction resolvase
MRRAAKSDGNQPAVVRAFRDIGATVQVLSAVGKGCPDLLVGWRGRNLLIEVKDREGRGVRLTADQERWHAGWNGTVLIADSPEDAVRKVIRAVLQ